MGGRAGERAGRGRFKRLLGLAIFCALAADPAAAERPDDVAGWRGAAWGMDRAALEEAFGGRLTHLPGSWEFGGAHADLAIRDAAIDDVTFLALFQMNDDTGRLQQVLMERRRVGATPATFATVLDSLEVRYGPPDHSCTIPNAGRSTLAVEMIWVFPTTTLHATFLDFDTTAIQFREPGTFRDPLISARESRTIVRRFLPRRVLVRYHPTERTDLLSPPPCDPRE